MSGWPSLPRPLRIAALLAVVGLAVTVPLSNPDGTGMQWDEVVLGALAVFVCRRLVVRTRAMAPDAARPWRVMAAGAALFAAAQWLEAAFPGPAFDGFGVDKVLLFAGACSPLATCGFLALRVRRTRWTALAVDGLMVTVALFVVAEVLATPNVHADAAPADLRSMVLLYGGYAGVMLGGAGVLCTVSTTALRRAASAMMGAVVLQAVAACCEAMAIVAPHPLWTAGSDVAVASSLMTALLACTRAPRRDADHTARAAAPRVSVAGTAIVVVGVLGIPLALVLSLVDQRPLSSPAVVGCAAVFVLLAARLVLRIREDGRLSEDLVRREEDFQELIESSSNGVAIVDESLTLLFTSPAARGLLGIDRDAGRSLTLPSLVDASSRDQVAVRLADPAALDGTLHALVAGGTRELEIVGPERTASGRRVLYLRDVTTRRRRERELERMAYTDHLTGLPNRAMLFEELGQTASGTAALLVVDLDGFKAVNDDAGHEAGDQLLVEVARRLNTVVRSEDLVARLGGDEFAVLVTGTLDDAVEVAERIVDALAVPHQVARKTFAIGASVGVSMLDAGGGQLAFREADTALRAAKRAGKGCVRLATVAAVAPVERDLAAALAAGELQVRFDTALDPDGRTAMVHAVPVWSAAGAAPVRGPDLWAAAEQQGVSATLQSWLLQRACAEVAGLDATLNVAVSLPNGQVVPAGLASMVADALAATGIPPSRLTLSFTEETLLTSSADLVPELEAVRAAGVRLCLDNYGMGHSLFALLARVPLDAVRADLARIAVRDDTERALQILAAIVQITTGLGLTVIAGGIHTPELRAAVLASGVQLTHGRAQPYDLSRGDLAAVLAAEAPLPV